jgi:hypothetical protein
MADESAIELLQGPKGDPGVPGGNVRQSIMAAVGDEDSILTTGSAKLTFRVPYGFTLTGVRANSKTAPTGSALVVDINQDTGGGPVSILSTKISIDAGTKTSLDSVNPPVLDDVNLVDDAEITVDIDAIGSTIAGAGLKIELIGHAGNPVEAIVAAVSNEFTPLTTGTDKLTFRMPYAFVLSGVRANVKTAPTGSAITVDINVGGVSILTTEITIDAGEKTSVTAVTPPVIDDPNLGGDVEITVDIDAVGASVAGLGLKIALIGAQP